jgi:probable F420-dependent oxidoreductase
MQLGIVTPGLTMLPGAHARWEETADFGDIVTVVEAAERLGYHHVTCSEHVGIPEPVAAQRGGRYYDPLATFGYFAARTTTIRFETHVLVLGYHHPLAIAKRYGTLDRICGGRLILGVGVGSLEEEFALLDAPYADRGARADDAMRALRASFGRKLPEYAGPYYAFEGFVIDPCGVQSDIAMWVGGRTARSLRRAVELGEGWAPFGLRSTEIRSMLDTAAETEAWERRPRPIEVVLQNERPFDVIGEPDRIREQLERSREAGATILNARFVHHSAAHYIEQMQALVELV